MKVKVEVRALVDLSVVTKSRFWRMGCNNCSYDILLKLMNWNPYETDITVEAVPKSLV